MAEVMVRVEQPARATPAVVYDVLMDVERWSDWMPTVSAASWERRGSPGRLHHHLDDRIAQVSPAWIS